MEVDENILNDTKVALTTPPEVERRKCRCPEGLEAIYHQRRDMTLEKMILFERAVLALDFAKKNLERIKTCLQVLNLLELEAYLDWQKALKEEDEETK